MATIIAPLLLQPGTLLGPYRIVAPLGVGGMGEVYRAHDARLNREVALKILRPEFAADAERLQRFVREAQTLAALNHAHIAQIHGIEEAPADDSGRIVRALVMEFVEGEDLSDRLARGPLPLDECLEIAGQIAEAVEAAHEQGIIHRDLKPANVKIRRDGTVKVLDFGLAKALEPGSSSPSGAALANSPTLTSPAMTAAGVILGTAAYMSPEQARGRPVDKRADIWAFGVVLYEMLSGRAAYVGETVTDLLAAVVTREPDWGALPESVPPSVQHLLRRCLEKDHRLRLRDMGEARVVLANVDALGPPIPNTPPVVAPRRAVGHFLPWVLTGLAVVAGASAWLWKPTPAAPLRKLELALPVEGSSPVTLSPDGRHAAFRSRGKISVTDLDQVGTRDLTASPPSQRNIVFWSHDSAFVGYNDADGKLWTIPAGGGSPRLVCAIPETGQLLGATWQTNGAITFAVWRGNLYQVASTGGSPTQLAAIDPNREIDFHNPVALPDGRVLVATHLRPQSGDDDVYELEAIGQQQRETALGSGFFPVGYAAAGYVLLVRWDANTGLWALPFSGRLPLRIEEGFLVAPGAGFPSLANDGSLLYSLASTAPQTRELVWVDRSGQVVGQIGSEQVGLVTPPALSPDGRRVAFAVRASDNADVWVRDLESNVQTRITSEAVDQGSPWWFPSGRRLAYSEAGPVGLNRIAASNADGSGGRQELAKGMLPVISPDARYLTYAIDDPGDTQLRYSALSPEGTLASPQSLFKITPEPGIYGVRFSPDGRYLAYAERQPGGAMELFVTRFPSGEGRWQVSSGGGRGPVWAGNGELFFASGSNDGPKTIMAVATAAGSELAMGTPIKLFEVGPDIEISQRGASFDATHDGKQFVMVRSRRAAGAVSPVRWVLVQNWLSEFGSRR